MKEITIKTGKELQSHDFSKIDIREDLDIKIKLKLINQKVQFPITIHHNIPGKTSSVMIKMALYGSASLIMPVQIYVHPGATDTSTNFSATIYLMSPQTTAQITPGLFIHEKNIQSAGHGVVIKHIKESDIHYLLSRGIEYSTAEDMVIGLE